VNAPEWLSVIADALLERGLNRVEVETVCTLIINPTVIETLRDAEMWVRRDEEDGECADCGEYMSYDRDVTPHNRDCRSARLARLLVPGWGEAEVEAAHASAVSEDAVRTDNAMRGMTLDGRREATPEEATRWRIERVERMEGREIRGVWRPIPPTPFSRLAGAVGDSFFGIDRYAEPARLTGLSAWLPGAGSVRDYALHEFPRPFPEEDTHG
jgi:hypothetical protein